MGVLIHIPPARVPIGKDIKPHPLFWPFPQGTLTRILWLSVRGYLNSSVQKRFYFWIEWSNKNRGDNVATTFLKTLLWRFKTWPSLPGLTWKGYLFPQTYLILEAVLLLSQLDIYILFLPFFKDLIILVKKLFASFYFCLFVCFVVEDWKIYFFFRFIGFFFSVFNEFIL